MASPGWVRPSDVMKNRNKAKRRALQARMNTSLPLQILMPAKSERDLNLKSSVCNKRRNPFKCFSNTEKSQKLDEQDGDSSENSTDCSLFQMINSKPFQLKKNESYDISQVLKEKNNLTDSESKIHKMWSEKLHVDWSLKSKVRFLSLHPLPWKHNFKTSEEASGTTGFVRCLKAGMKGRDGRLLDTSSNAQFYECCLVWQHPNLPTVSLFPRDKQKPSAQTGLYGTDTNIATELHSEWSESLRSLYQLLRVRQCPYFYVCGHSFTCLFRAAGVGGVTHTHALITPTTRGFRDAMQKEGIEFSLPFLNKKINTNSKEDDEISQENDLDSDDDKEFERKESSSFLEDLGLETKHFPTLNQNRTKKNKYRGLDGFAQSLIYIEDMELHGLINFILNCSSCVVSTGLLAGVPPTLLSPVAFQGGTLKSLKVNSSQIRNAEGQIQYSVDIRGPILPTTLLHLTTLLTSSIDYYNVNLQSVLSTMSFNSFVSSRDGQSSVPLAFASEGLVDCGLGKEIRSTICQPPCVHTSEESLPLSYKEIIYKENMFTWSDK